MARCGPWSHSAWLDRQSEGRVRSKSRGWRGATVDRTEIFEAERPRLLGIASRVPADHAEVEDIVQQAWLRLHRERS